MPGIAFATDDSDDAATEESPPPGLPARLQLLCVGLQQPTWVGLALQLDAQGCNSPRFQWAHDAREAAAALREDHHDCVLVVDAPDPVGVTEAVRSSGSVAPLIVAAPSLDERSWARIVELDGEVLISRRPWSSPALMPMLRRAIRHERTAADLQRLAIDHRRRLAHDRDEAERLLRQQQAMIAELGSFVDGDLDRAAGPAAEPAEPVELPSEVDAYYHELLRTYVIMGSGRLDEELGHLAELLAVAGLGPRDALRLHLERVESLVRGLGNRSSRHVMSRANLLALELVVRLGECYQGVAGEGERGLSVER